MTGRAERAHAVLFLVHDRRAVTERQKCRFRPPGRGESMQGEELRRHSRWLMRAMEWDDARARYPNIWHDGMPRHVLAFDRVASRLRLGDLIAAYYPASQRHARRSERFIGISRVVGLRAAHADGYAWIDLHSAHKFDPPLDLGQQPRRVFLCCDPGWPDPEIDLFRQVFAAAVKAGWEPMGEDQETSPTVDSTAAPTLASKTEESASKEPIAEAPDDVLVEKATAAATGTVTDTTEAARDPVVAPVEPSPRQPLGRLFAGVDFSGDMRDPRDATWLAVVELRDERLRVHRLDATGRHGLQNYLRDPDSTMMSVEAIGLDFPFGLPIDFAQKLMGRDFPEEGWWALAKRLEKLSRPDYLIAVQDFRDETGESKRYTDETAQAFSPLHRVNPDLGPMTYHGIRMIAEDRSRYAVKPFESALGKLLLEVYPGGFVKQLALPTTSVPEGQGRERRRHILNAMGRLDYLPIELDDRVVKNCLHSRDALDAVIAARMAAVAVMTGEVERTPEELAPDAANRVRHEGWIYGLEKPA